MNRKVFLFFVACLFSATVFTQNKPEELLIGSEKVSAGFIGNGVQFGLYELAYGSDSPWGQSFGMYMDDAQWEKTFERLDFMKMGLVRTMISAKGFSFRGMDKSGKPIIKNDYHVDLVDKWLNYCDRNNIDVLWGEWGTGTVAPITDTLWSNAIIGYADYLINARKHKSLKYFIGVNEPDGDWTDATKGKFEPWETATENLYRSIQQRKLEGRLQIAAPDACPGITGTGFIEKTAQSLRDKIGIWNIHIYPYPEQIRNGSYEGLIRKWHEDMGLEKKLVIGEIGMKHKRGTPERDENLRRAKEDPMQKSDTLGGANMYVYDYFYAIDVADLYIQCMRGGMSGGCAWMACDAMNSNSGQRMRRWGLWNIFGSKMGFPEDENIRPWFYPLSLLCRYFPQGSDILSVGASSRDGVRAVAGTCNGEITVAVVNNSGEPQKVKLKMDGEKNRSMKKYVCFENDRPTDKKQLPVPKNKKTVNLSKGEEIELPALGFVLLTSINY
jgi:hypothetical protein